MTILHTCRDSYVLQSGPHHAAEPDSGSQSEPQALRIVEKFFLQVKLAGHDTALLWAALAPARGQGCQGRAHANGAKGALEAAGWLDKGLKPGAERGAGSFDKVVRWPMHVLRQIATYVGCDSC